MRVGVSISTFSLMVLMFIYPARASNTVHHVFVFPHNDMAIGVMDAVAIGLSDHPEIEVVPYDSTLKARGNLRFSGVSPIVFGKELGANFILTGSVEKKSDGLVFKGIYYYEGVEREWIFTQEDSWSLATKISLEMAKILKVNIDILDIHYSNNMDAGDLYRLGLIYKNNSDFISAASLFESSLAVDADFSMAKLRLAQCLFVQGDLEKTKEAAAPLLFHGSSTLRIAYFDLMQNVMVYQGFPDESIRLLTSALEEANSGNHYRLLPKIYLSAAQTLSGTGGDSAEVTAFIEKARSAHVENQDNRGLAEVALLAARQRMRSNGEKDSLVEKDIASARFWADSLPYPQIQASADFIEIYGAWHIGGRNPKFASQDLLKKLGLAERRFLEVGSHYSFFNARYERMIIHFRQGNLELAKQIGNDLVKDSKKRGLFVSEIRLRNKLSDIYRQAGDHHTAIHFLEESLYRMGKQSFSYHKRNILQRLVSLLTLQRRFDQAQIYSERWLKEANHPGYDQERFAFLLNNHAEILVKLDQFDEAERYFLRALTIKRNYQNPESIAWTLRNLAGLYIFKSRYSLARQKIEEIRGFVSDDPFLIALEALLLFGEGFPVAGQKKLQSLTDSDISLRDTEFEALLKDIEEGRWKENPRILLPNYLDRKLTTAADRDH